jgi:hypothetical protein
MRQESLLPNTKAIPRGTVEFECRQKVLVRYKTMNGTVWQRQFKDREAAHRQFLEWVGRLEEEARSIRDSRAG